MCPYLWQACSHEHYPCVILLALSDLPAQFGSAVAWSVLRPVWVPKFLHARVIPGVQYRGNICPVGSLVQSAANSKILFHKLHT